MVEAVNSVQNTNANSMQFEFLEHRLNAIDAEQGFFGSFWNNIKEITSLGCSMSDCKSKLEEFKNNEITFEEALNYIENFGKKQKDAVDLTTNIITGVGAIGAAVITGGTTVALETAINVGIPTGSVIKTGLNIFDRATNDIENDAFDVKQMAKDAISGGITGLTSAVSSKVGDGIRGGEIKTSILNGTKCGLACGALSGAGSYMNGVIFDDEQFDFDKLTANAIFSSAVSGSVGAFVGLGMFQGASLLGTAGKNIEKSVSETIVSDSAASSARKILGTAEKNIITT